MYNKTLSHFRTTLLCLLLFSGLSLMQGCSQNRVEPMDGPLNMVTLEASAIVDIMQQAGFTSDEILELGPGLHNCLALQGAARIRIDNVVEAMFAVHTPFIHVSSRRRGSLVYPIPSDAPATTETLAEESCSFQAELGNSD